MQVVGKHGLHHVFTHSGIWTDVDVSVFVKPFVFVHQRVSLVGCSNSVTLTHGSTNSYFTAIQTLKFKYQFTKAFFLLWV